MNTYRENRFCAEMLSRLLSHQFGKGLKVNVKPNPDPKKAANEQAAYGLQKVDERAGK